jgi:UDP-N-acetylmuramoyl-tripeptide--D-alanyl-D-alanine ligase
MEPCACFVAIRSNRDGHEFADQAVAKGAGALLVDHALDLPVPQLVVPDTLLALQRWGKERLAFVMPKATFGITGSVGKTSTKDLLAGATGAWKTPGNRNNTLGMPEALASLPMGTAAVVLEMGMSTPGEIKRLTEIAPLDFGLITMIGTAHAENFPDGQQGIARAKGELVDGIKPGGAWVHLVEDEWCRWISQQPWASHTKALPIGASCDYSMDKVESLGAKGESFRLQYPSGSLEIKIRLRGSHQVRNAALAASLALVAGFTPERIVEGLAEVEPEWGRGRLHPLKGGGWLLDESYNASPDSIHACASALLELEGGEAVAVLGSMRELGPEAERMHQETGAKLKAMGFHRLWTYGDFAAAYTRGFGMGALAYPAYEDLLVDSRGLGAIPNGARILVKGSRYWQAERAVEWLLQQHALIPDR